MAEISKSSGSRRQPSRLQRRAPASIQISPVSDWNIAIPLLSPLVTPPSLPCDPTVEIKSCNAQRHRNQVTTETEKPMVFEKWQHPAAPFCYEPAPLVPFLCTGAADRT